MRVGIPTNGGIRIKVYGVRMETTATATHVVFYGVGRDPDRTICPCEFCQSEDQTEKRWSRF